MLNVMLQPGALRHTVSIEKPVETTNAYGEREVTWVAHKSDWRASIEPLAGRELWQAQQVQADVSHRVRIRYVAGVTPRMRIVFGTRTFQISSITNTEERNVELVLLCREAV